MKGNKKILVIAILLLLIAVSYGTYAIYRTSISGNVTVDAAAWTEQFKDGNTAIQNMNIAFGQNECTNTHVVAGKIAPGVSCTKTITIDATGTEVDVTYTAELDGSVTSSNNQVTLSDANAFNVTLTPASGIITHGNATRTQDVVVTLAWAGTDSESNPNTADTALAGSTFTVPIKLTAKQYLGS